MGMHGIDVSRWNTESNAQKAIDKYSCKFIIIKATEGKSYQDPKVNEWVEFAMRNHIAIGFYHYARPDNGNSAVEECANFISTVNKLCYKYNINEWFPVLDWEGASIGFEDPWLSYFCQDFLSMTSKPVCIYTNQLGASKIDRNMAGVVDCGLWIATRGRQASQVPNTNWNVTAMHQYKVDKELNIDINYFFGNANQFFAYCVKNKKDKLGTVKCGINHCGCNCM